MIELMKGTDAPADWYIKANEIITAVNELRSSEIPPLKLDRGLDVVAMEITNDLVKLVNLYNGE